MGESPLTPQNPSIFQQALLNSIRLVEQARARGTVVGAHTVLWGALDQACPRQIQIGECCLLATESMVLSHGPLTIANQGPPVIIEKGVYVCFRAIILPGRRIGEGSIVGAGAVVSRDVPPMTHVAGNPARVVNQRDPARLQEFLAWCEKWVAS